MILARQLQWVVSVSADVVDAVVVLAAASPIRLKRLDLILTVPSFVEVDLAWAFLPF